MELTASQLRYFLTICRFEKKGPVRSAYIAMKLSVTRPSAHRMICEFVNMGLITKEKNSSVRTTKEGRAISAVYISCYDRICTALTGGLGIPVDSAQEGALAVLGSLGADMLGTVLTNAAENEYKSQLTAAD